MERERQDLQDQIEFDITTIFYDILKNWWAILMGALAAAILTFVIVNEMYVPEYTTRTTFVVSSKGDFNASSNLYSTNTMAKTFQRILQRSH